MDWPAFWLAESFIYPHSGKVGYNYFLLPDLQKIMSLLFRQTREGSEEGKGTLLNVVVTQWPLKSSGHRSC